MIVSGCRVFFEVVIIWRYRNCLSPLPDRHRRMKPSGILDAETQDGEQVNRMIYNAFLE